jgi:hypothetical protein
MCTAAVNRLQTGQEKQHAMARPAGRAPALLAGSQQG